MFKGLVIREMVARHRRAIPSCVVILRCVTYAVIVHWSRAYAVDCRCNLSISLARVTIRDYERGLRMAFLIDCTMKGYKVLGVKSGTSKKGNTFYSMTVYRDGRTAEVSCTNPELFPAVVQLREMDTVNLDVMAVSGKERSYISLLEAPVMVEPSPLAGE